MSGGVQTGYNSLQRRMPGKETDANNDSNELMDMEQEMQYSLPHLASPVASNQGYVGVVPNMPTPKNAPTNNSPGKNLTPVRPANGVSESTSDIPKVSVPNTESVTKKAAAMNDIMKGLRSGGIVILTLPDMQSAAREVKLLQDTAPATEDGLAPAPIPPNDVYRNHANHHHHPHVNHKYNS